MSYTPYDGSRYLDWEEIEELLHAMAREHDDLVSLKQVGESHHGKPIWMVTLCLGERALDERSILWLDAGTHASEWTGVSALLYSLSQWIEGIATRQDQELARWFETRAIVAIPCISPDGYDALRRGAPYLRSSLRPPRHDEPRVGLDPADINGDGKVRWMRWRHPAGPLVQDEDVPLFMRPRTLDDDPDDAFFVCSEGEFIGWDGVRWTGATARHGVDLNRNFPANWKPFSMFGMDAGAYSASEPESRAVLDAFASLPTIAAGLTYHTYTGCILTQPYQKDSPLGESDLFVIQKLADDLVEDTGYEVYKVFPDFMYRADRPTPGVWSDTMTTVFGVPSYTVEFWNPYRASGVEVEKPAEFFTRPDPKIIREMIRFASAQPGATPWTRFEHPQLGEVEIGGIDYMRTIRNPPEQELLVKECATGHAMAERLRRALPLVHVSASVERLGERLFALELQLENTGYLSTSALEHARNVNATPGCKASLSLSEGTKLSSSSQAHLIQPLPHLAGWGERLLDGGQHAIYPSLGSSSSRHRVTWLIEGEVGRVIRGEVHLGRAGRQKLTIALEDRGTTHQEDAHDA